MNKITVYLGLGSNLGDRADWIRQTLNDLRTESNIEVRAVSDLRETAPVGGPPGQGDYLNGAAEIATTLEPLELLARLQDIEVRLGRVREQRWGPRTIDLDILLCDSEVIDLPELIVPHPRLAERLFVLRPLAQIAPDCVHPVLNKTMSQLLQEREALCKASA